MFPILPSLVEIIIERAKIIVEGGENCNCITLNNQHQLYLMNYLFIFWDCVFLFHQVEIL
jgi:hypothetical protein